MNKKIIINVQMKIEYAIGTAVIGDIYDYSVAEEIMAWRCKFADTQIIFCWANSWQRIHVFAISWKFSLYKQ